jgi:hypothetical protein
MASALVRNVPIRCLDCSAFVWHRCPLEIQQAHYAVGMPAVNFIYALFIK